MTSRCPGKKLPNPKRSRSKRASVSGSTGVSPPGMPPALLVDAMRARIARPRRNRIASGAGLPPSDARRNLGAPRGSGVAGAVYHVGATSVPKSCASSVLRPIFGARSTWRHLVPSDPMLLRRAWASFVSRWWSIFPRSRPLRRRQRPRGRPPRSPFLSRRACHTCYNLFARETHPAGPMEVATACDFRPALAPGRARFCRAMAPNGAGRKRRRQALSTPLTVTARYPCAIPPSKSARPAGSGAT